MRRSYLAGLVWVAISGTAVLAIVSASLFPGMRVQTALVALLLAALIAALLGRRLHRETDGVRGGIERLPDFDAGTDWQALPEFRGVERALREQSRALRKSLAGADDARRELEALLDSMQDAVVAVDAAGAHPVDQ